MSVPDTEPRNGDEIVEDKLRSHWLSRSLRFVLTIAIAFFATTVFVQGTARQQCEDGKPFLVGYTHRLSVEAKTLTVLVKTTQDPVVKKLRIQQLDNDKALLTGLSQAVQFDCVERFPFVPLLNL